MIEVFHLCESIAAGIAAKEWTFHFTPEAKWVMTTHAEQVSDLAVTLVPESEVKTLVGRSEHTNNVALLSLLVQKNVADQPSEVPALAQLVDLIDEFIRKHGLFATLWGKWQIISLEKVFIREQLEQFNVFTAGAVLTFKSAGK